MDEISDEFESWPYPIINFRVVFAKTYIYNFDPLKPHFYIVKLGFTGLYIIFLIIAQKQILNTHNLWFEQKYEKYQNHHENMPI